MARFGLLTLSLFVLTTACGGASEGDKPDTNAVDTTEPTDTKQSDTTTKPTDTKQPDTTTKPKDSGPSDAVADVADSVQTVDCSKKNLVVQETGSSDYQAYTMVSASNSAHSARDGDGVLHVSYLDANGNITVAAQQSDGTFEPTVVAPAPGGSDEYRSPTLKESGGGLHVAWLETTDTQSIIQYAVRAAGSTSWTQSVLTSVDLDPSTAADWRLKYPALTVSGDGQKPFAGATQGFPDLRAILVTDSGPVFAELNSGNPTWKRSSDLTLASEGDLMVVVWEEVWEKDDNGQPLEIGDKMNLVFSISEDGGTTWSAADHLLAGDTNSHGGDPSVCIDNGVMYVVYHKDLIPVAPGSDVTLARRLPGQARFQLLDVGTAKPGVIGRGWLPTIDCNSGHVVVAWEETDSIYMDKYIHRLGVAHIDNAPTNASISYTPLGDIDITNEQSYELAMSVTLSEDGQQVDVFWVDVWNDLSKTPTAFTATLFHRSETFNDPACASPSLTP